MHRMVRFCLPHRCCKGGGGHQLRQHCRAQNFVELITTVILGPPIKFVELKYSLFRNSFFVEQTFLHRMQRKTAIDFLKFVILKYLLNRRLLKCEFIAPDYCALPYMFG